MLVVVSDPAVELIAEGGGRLYVWPKKSRCCGAITRLVSASDPPRGKQFRRVSEDDRFELFLPIGLARLPDELYIDAHRFPRRVEAYWDGCAWVT
jgi:hypothetical protein